MPQSAARSCDIIVVAASAGGVEALLALVSGLPADVQAAVFVVLHMSDEGPSRLAHILDRRGQLPAEVAEDGAPIFPGRVYAAVPGRHLALERGRMRLLAGPRENGHRPSADVLFRSAAKAYGPRVLGVVLSGADDDGAAGLTVIRRAGGLAVAQDPKEALHPRMPQSALDSGAADYCMRAAQIAALVTELAPASSALATELTPTGSPLAEEAPALPEPIDVSENLAMQPVENRYQDGPPAVYTCPECHGTLWEVDEGGVLRFRCRVGHAFTADKLLSGQAENVEAALWIALRTIEERCQLGERMAQRARGEGLIRAARRFEQSIEESKAAAETLRGILLGGESAGAFDAGASPDDKAERTSA